MFGKAIFVAIGSLVFGIQAGLALEFGTTQLDISVATGFDHDGLCVEVSGIDSSAMMSMGVSSDADWVTPTVDAEAGVIALAFTTSALNADSTATITASTAGAQAAFFVRANVATLNVIRLADDPFRSRAYGVHNDGIEVGAIVAVDTASGDALGSLTVGKRPTDLAVSSDGEELYVINCHDATVSVIDLESFALTRAISVDSFKDCPTSTRSANIKVGPDDILYCVDADWAPAIHVIDSSNGSELQVIDSIGPGSVYGFGDIAVSPDFSFLYGWAQYGWNAGLVGSFVAKFEIDGGGLLQHSEDNGSEYPTIQSRYPIEAPALLSGDGRRLIVKEMQFDAAEIGRVTQVFPDDVYAISPGGEWAASADGIRDVRTGEQLLAFDQPHYVQIFSRDYASLVYFDAESSSLQKIDLAPLIDFASSGIGIAPAHMSSALAPSTLRWVPQPGAVSYDVWLSDEDDLASAELTSASYLGGSRIPSIAVADQLALGSSYFWRVDSLSAEGVIRTDFYEFEVAGVIADADEVVTQTVSGHKNHRVGIGLEWVESPADLTYSATSDWISFPLPDNTARLEIEIDTTALRTGYHYSEIVVADSLKVLFRIPVSVYIANLVVSELDSDPGSSFIYAVSDDPEDPISGAFVVKADCQNEEIVRTCEVGFSITDLAIHSDDDRLYAAAWEAGLLLGLDLDDLEQEVSFAFDPGDGSPWTHNDVYSLSAGSAGRLFIGQEDVSNDFSIFDTNLGVVLDTHRAYYGSGAASPDGSVFYLGDDHPSDKSLARFSLTGDRFYSPGGRSPDSSVPGKALVVVSEDGSHVYWNGAVYASSLLELWDIGEHIYSASGDGRYAIGQRLIYDVIREKATMGMPADSQISTYNTATEKLVVPVAGKLSYHLLSYPPVLVAPVLTAVSAMPDSVDLVWDDLSIELSFTLQYRQVGSPGWIDNSEPLPRNSIAFTLNGLTPEVDYEVRIKAEGDGVSSPWSDSMVFTTPMRPPDRPVLSIADVAYDAVVLSWPDADGNVDTYRIERVLYGGSEWTALAVSAGGTVEFTDNSVVAGERYYYRIIASNAGGDSSASYSRYVSVPEPSPPLPPSMTRARPLSATSAGIVWSAVYEVDSYSVERRSGEAADWVPHMSFPAETTGFVDVGLLEGSQYCYRVFAVNEVGASVPGPEVCVVAETFVCLVETDFSDEGIPAWTDVVGGEVISDGGQGFPEGEVLWFGGEWGRYLATGPLDVSQGGRVEFVLRTGNTAADGVAYWRDGTWGEEIFLEYSVDGSNWVAIEQFMARPDLTGEWASYWAEIPTNAISEATRFRWNQPFNYPVGGFWALDSLAVKVPIPPAPAPPESMLAVSNTANTAGVFWEPVAFASGYTIERLNPGGSITVVADLDSAATLHTDRGLQADQTYAYRLAAIGAGGSSAFTEWHYVTTIGALGRWLDSHFPGEQQVLTRGQLLATGNDLGQMRLSLFAYGKSPNDGWSRFDSETGTAGDPDIYYDRSRGLLCAHFRRWRQTAGAGIYYDFQIAEGWGNWTSVATEPLRLDTEEQWEEVLYEIPVSGESAYGRVRLRYVGE